MLTVRVYGEGRVKRSFRSLAIRVRDLSPAWARVGASIKRTAIPFTPVKSGALVATIREQATRHGTTVIAGGGSVEYAGVQNYGWPARNIKAHHFLNRALELNQDTAGREALSTVERLGRRVGFN